MRTARAATGRVLPDALVFRERIVILVDGRVVQDVSCGKGHKPAPVDVIGYIV